MDVGTFAAILAVGGMRYNGSCISWGRSHSRNSDVGGHSDSFHMLWLAADLTFDSVDDKNKAARYYRRMGLHTKDNSDHTLHIQVVPPEV